jgi:hypothetical protein
MPDRILTSHAGSLPRPEDLIALNEQRAAGDFTDEAEYLSRLRTAVADVVARQRETGIDLVNDGEFGHSMGCWNRAPGIVTLSGTAANIKDTDPPWPAAAPEWHRA